MSTQHTPADDIVYDLVSVQYHALQGAQAKDKYIADAGEHHDVAEFFAECARQDAWRAQRCHDILVQLTGRGAGIGSS